MSYTDDTIADRIFAIAAAYGTTNGFIPPKAIWNDDMRDNARAMVTELGVDLATARTLSDRKLWDFYTCTRKSVDGGRRMARRLSPAPHSPSGPVQAPHSPSGPDMAQLAADITQTAVDAATGAAETAVHALLNASLPAIVAAEIAKLQPTRLEITQAGKPPVTTGLVHKDMAKVMRWLCSYRLHVYLHGPAGSGKTTVARMIADAMNLPLHCIGKVESEYLLLGFENATKLVCPAFRRAWEFGGIFLLDELDRSSAGAIVALNMALANGYCAFPDGTIACHPDFYCIGAGNTPLTGASHLYGSAERMDMSSVDRFAFIEFGYDEQLELALASDKAWCLHVQSARRAVAERGLDLLISPRATEYGCRALAQGADWSEVEEVILFKGLDRETVDQIKHAMRSPILASVAA